jgi:hypothetical protein
MVEEVPVVSVYRDISDLNAIFCPRLVGSKTTDSNLLLRQHHSSMCSRVLFLHCFLDWVVSFHALKVLTC